MDTLLCSLRSRARAPFEYMWNRVVREKPKSNGRRPTINNSFLQIPPQVTAEDEGLQPAKYHKELQDVTSSLMISEEMKSGLKAWLSHIVASDLPLVSYVYRWCMARDNEWLCC